MSKVTDNVAPAPVFTKYWPTFVLLCASTVIEKGVEQVVPSLFPQLDNTLSLGPTKLAAFPLTRALPQAIAGVVGALVAHHVNRKHCIMLGCMTFGVCLSGYSQLNSFAGGCAAMFCAGLGLAVFLPASYSLVADTVNKDSWGKAFGTQFFVGASACGLTSFISIYVGGLIIGGLTGWRFMNLIIGIFSITIGIVADFFVKDPRMEFDDGTTRYWGILVPGAGGWKAYWHSLKDCCQGSFGVIVIQGIFSQVPFNVMIFWAYFFQSCNFGAIESGSIMLAFWVCTGFGGLFWGWVADYMEKKWPFHGRVIVAQACGLLSVVLSIVLFQGVPRRQGSYVAYVVLCALMGCTASATASCCSMPIIGQIVQERNRTAAYALDRCLENPLGAILAVFAGKFSEKLGWKDPAKYPDPHRNEMNADSMAKAQLIFMAVFWSASAILLSGLHWTYKKDYERARAKAAQKQAEDAARQAEYIKPKF